MAGATNREALSRTKEELAVLYERLDELEQLAGIHAKAEKIREGRFWPDMNETTDEYFEAEREHIRQGIRPLYFSVPNKDVRMNLIRKQREIALEVAREWDRDVANAQREVREAEAALRRLPWGMAAGIAGGCVTIGYLSAEIAGAIGGAVVGFFLGQGTIENARSQRAAALRAAQDVLAEWIKRRDDVMAKPEPFSASEADTGEIQLEPPSGVGRGDS